MFCWPWSFRVDGIYFGPFDDDEPCIPPQVRQKPPPAVPAAKKITEEKDTIRVPSTPKPASEVQPPEKDKPVTAVSIAKKAGSRTSSAPSSSQPSSSSNSSSASSSSNSSPLPLSASSKGTTVSSEGCGGYIREGKSSVRNAVTPKQTAEKKAGLPNAPLKSCLAPPKKRVRFAPEVHQRIIPETKPRNRVSFAAENSYIEPACANQSTGGTRRHRNQQPDEKITNGGAGAVTDVESSVADDSDDERAMAKIRRNKSRTPRRDVKAEAKVPRKGASRRNHPASRYVPLEGVQFHTATGKVFRND